MLAALTRRARSGTGSPGILLWGLVVACVLAATAVTSSPAGAGPTNGSINGIVTNTTLGPLSNIRVDAFNSYYGNLVGSATTNGSGAYSIPNVPPNQTVVRFTDPTANFVTQHYAGAPTWAAATRVVPPLGGSVTANATLSANVGTIAGTVTDASAAPVANITVTIYNSYYGNVVATRTTDAAGSYEAAALAATNYVVMFSDPTSGYATTYHPGVPSYSLASTVAVTAAATTTVHATLGRTGRISGHIVVGPSNLANIYVLAATTAPVALAGAAISDAEGNYTINALPAGDYKLLFVDPVWLNDQATGYRPQFFNGIDTGNTANLAANFDAAPVQHVVVDEELTDRNASMVGAQCDPAILFPGANLTGANLASANLQGCNLTNVMFLGANLSHANLTGANLTDAYAGMSDLRYAILTNATITGIVFLEARVWGVRSGGVIGAPRYNVMPYEWELRYGYLLGPGNPLVGTGMPGADLSGVDLTGLNLWGVDLSWAILAGATLDHTSVGSRMKGADLSRANLVYAYLGGVDLSGANLSGASLGVVNFTGSNLEGTNFAGATIDRVISGATGTPINLPSPWLYARGHLVGPNATLVGADLRNTVLTGANLSGANLTGALLQGVISGNITGTPSALPAGWSIIGGHLVGPGANFSSADLTGADFSNRNLINANFSNANLRNANFTNSILTGATFTGANVTGTVFTNATFTGVRSGGLSGTPSALPTNFVLAAGHFVGPAAYLVNANLGAAALNGVDLTEANLTGANLTATDLTGANLTNVTISNATIGGVVLSLSTISGVTSGGLIGSPASLPSSSVVFNGYLVGPGANLSNAVLTGISLNGVSLTGAVLNNVRTGGITGTPTGLPTTWIVYNGHLVGPGANLTDAVLTNADLTTVSLLGATLTGVRSGGITGLQSQGALSYDWKLANGYLLGPGANLVGASLVGFGLNSTNLSGADLSGATLDNVSFGAASFYDTNLTGAHIRRASFSYDNLTGANFTNADLMDTDFNNANVDGTDFTGASFLRISGNPIANTPSNLPPGWVIRASSLLGPTAQLSLADLATVDLDGIDLSNADLTRVKSGGITGTPSGLPTGWALLNGYLVGPTANLVGANFAGVDLTGANFTNTNLTGANFAGANLPNATFVGSTLDAIWVPVPYPGYMASANFTNANLTGANFNQVSIDGATLTGANIAGANFSGNSTAFERVKSGGVIGTPLTLPAGCLLANGYLLGYRVDVTGANLSGLNLSGAYLQEATFTNTTLVGTTFTNDNLSFANFTNANLTNANLTAVNLSGSTLTGATMTGATMTSVRSMGVVGVPAALPAGWLLRSNIFVGPTADLSFMNFNGVDLTGANLAAVNLMGSNLTGATLTGVSSGGILLGNSLVLPAGWSLFNGYLVGAGANLTGAVLSFINLTNVNLTGTNFTNAKLGYATLNGANLTGSVVTGANLGGTKLTGTIFTNIAFTNVNLNGSTGTPVYGGATFSNTICPNATNSNAHGNTCQGHPWP